MEKLIVKNFLNLRDIELNVSKVNILIGPQANGKSILAKLVYFFKNFFVEYRQSIAKKQDKKEFDKNLISNFKEIFPEYSWSLQEFEITFFYEQYYVKLFSQKLLKTKYTLVLDYSEHLVKIRKKLFIELNKLINSQDSITSIQVHEHIDKLFSQNILSRIEYLTFIPSGRSFFANLQNNIFTFLNAGMDIDYFLKEFGSKYEMIKRIYVNISEEGKESFQKENKNLIDDLFYKIIVGNYVYENEQEWIFIDHNRKIKLLHSSSGQQEALPIVLILAFSPFMAPNQMFIIEEPEAHLFPSSQNNIINLLSLVFNATAKQHKFFITTHSPYILTAFNNFIQAGNSLKTLQAQPGSEDLIKKLVSIIPENQMLDIDDIGAYTIKDGMLKSIINQENKLIDTNIIDEVSNEFSIIFEQLLDLEFGE